VGLGRKQQVVKLHLTLLTVTWLQAVDWNSPTSEGNRRRPWENVAELTGLAGRMGRARKGRTHLARTVLPGL
jgi:hypothetical protein